jgi:preprotein translocase subunit SecA
MDVLKTGIGLRGYNQKDPLTEYKQDSYKLFTDLIQRIKFEAVKVLQLVQFDFTSPEEEEAAIEQIREELENDVADAQLNQSFEEGVIAEDSAALKPITGTKKPKRNDPCPCGSGKKYKNCCGQSGPKKGLLA